MKTLVMILITSSLLSACATTAHKMNKVSLGMSKGDAIDALGDPVSVSAINGVEYLNYRFTETRDDVVYHRETPYFVRIINGKVESYGRSGDFDSTKTPTVKVETVTTSK